MVKLVAILTNKTKKKLYVIQPGNFLPDTPLSREFNAKL
jgi:hypothetical protein